jgi:4-carboxymuconolactone decarboxylase
VPFGGDGRRVLIRPTNDVVFDDLWRRSDLTSRDRTLITIAAVAALGDDDQ